MKSYTTFTMLVGISGAGKSTYAEKLAKETNAVLIASDKVRETVYGTRANQSNPNFIFGVCHKAIIENLNNGKNVVFDATNLKRENRKQCLDKIKKEANDVFLQCHILVVPFEVCLEQNSSRNHIVPVSVLENQLCSFEIPFYEEGWNDIQLIPYEQHFFSCEKLSSYSLDKLINQGKNFYDTNLVAYATDDNSLFEKMQSRQDDINSKYGDLIKDKMLRSIATKRNVCNASMLLEYGKLSKLIKNKKMLYEKYAQIGTYELLCDCLEREYFVEDQGRIYEVSHKSLLEDSKKNGYVLAIHEILQTLFYVNYHNYRNQPSYIKLIKDNGYGIFGNIFGSEKLKILNLLSNQNCEVRGGI